MNCEVCHQAIETDQNFQMNFNCAHKICNNCPKTIININEILINCPLCNKKEESIIIKSYNNLKKSVSSKNEKKFICNLHEKEMQMIDYQNNKGYCIKCISGQDISMKFIQYLENNDGNELIKNIRQILIQDFENKCEQFHKLITQIDSPQITNDQLFQIFREIEDHYYNKVFQEIQIAKDFIREIDTIENLRSSKQFCLQEIKSLEQKMNLLANGNNHLEDLVHQITNQDKKIFEISDKLQKTENDLKYYEDKYGQIDMLEKKYVKEHKKLQNFIDKEKIQYLQDCLNLKKLNVVRIFKATKDGFSASAFHKICDNKENIIIIIKSDQNQVFGAYTDLSFHSTKDNFIKGKGNSFIFSLSKQSKHRYIGSKGEIYYQENSGPVFPGGADLSLCDECNTKSQSYSLLGMNYEKPKYQVEQDTQDYLAGQKNFLVYDYEVYQLFN